MVSLSVGLYAAVSAPYFLLVEAEVWAWPRPVTAAVGRARSSLETGRLELLWQAAIHVGHDVNWAIGSGQRSARQTCHASREACRDAVALLILLTTSPKGAMA